MSVAIDTAPIRILLVDDDVELSAMLGDYLAREGFDASAVADGESGIREALSGAYALAVVDVMMPGMSGTEVLRRIRLHSRMPVMMLTARGEDVDRIVGLEMGADDYVPKPCTPRELVARIRAILRRVQEPAGNGAEDGGDIVVGPLTVHPGRRSAELRGRPMSLTSTEFSLLEVLARHAGQVVSKQELSEQALCRPLVRYDRSIDVHMSSIRQKLGHRGDGQSWIQTVRGQGYQLSSH